MIISISFFEKKRKICSYFSKTVLKETANIRKIKIYYSFKTVSQDILRFKIGEKTEFYLTSFWRAEFYLTSFWRAEFYLTSFWRAEFYLTSFWKGNLEMISIFRLNSFIFKIPEISSAGIFKSRDFFRMCISRDKYGDINKFTGTGKGQSLKSLLKFWEKWKSIFSSTEYRFSVIPKVSSFSELLVLIFLWTDLL